MGTRNTLRVPHPKLPFQGKQELHVSFNVIHDGHGCVMGAGCRERRPQTARLQSRGGTGECLFGVLWAVFSITRAGEEVY